MAILVDNFSGTPLEGKGLSIQIDYAGRTDCQPVYIGYATPSLGLDTDKAVWKIMFLEYDGTLAAGCLIRRLWADGDTKYDNVWDDRLALNYS